MFDNNYVNIFMPEDLDANGHATIPAIYKKIISVISLNIKKEGYGVDVLSKRGLTWVLARCAIEFVRRPILYENTQTKVWRGSDVGVVYERNVEMTSSNLGMLCGGTTQWCILDKNTRKPVKIDMDSSLQMRDSVCRAPKRIKPFISDCKRSAKAGYSDCDFNGHLNNCRYIDLFFNLLPHHLFSFETRARLDVNFKSEVPFGADISTFAKEVATNEYEFCMYHNSELACCASFSVL